jgi:uncharacterized protein (TIGR02284 family)
MSEEDEDMRTGQRTYDTYNPPKGVPRKDPSATLNDCLRAELAACETYGLALEHADRAEVAEQLREIRENHRLRASLVSEFLRTRGVEPVTTGGIWGAFAKMVQRGANLFGDRTAVAALEEFEDHTLKCYADAIRQDNVEIRSLVETELLPKQQRTHELARNLRAILTRH